METPVNAANVQGDILGGGLPKKTETFILFQITDGKQFVKDLVKLAPLIKTVEQVLKDREDIGKHKKEKRPGLIKMVGVNIAFSYTGLHAMGIPDSKLLNTALMTSETDLLFKNGALADAHNLNDPLVGGDPNHPDWEPEFLGRVDGIILIAGDSHHTVDEKAKQVQDVFDHGHDHTVEDESHRGRNRSSIRIVKSLVGDVRPGAEDGHEHFGFLDGISNPLVAGFDPVVPGPAPIDASNLLTGHKPGTTPDWTTDGSLLAFRYLFQNVPEFNSFLRKNALRKDPVTGKDMSVEEGSELLGARLIGRWKSGAPTVVTPNHDDQALANDPNRVNKFDYSGLLHDATRCPWAAHLRRTNPRADLTAPDRAGANAIDNRRIARRGIPFGPELTLDERVTHKTKHDRGLLFACYQASIQDAFRFIQISWSNNAQFPFVLPQDQTNPPPSLPGLDPLIGEAAGFGTRQITGTDPTTANNVGQKPLDMPNFIIPRGGGYFFSPSLRTLKGFGHLVDSAGTA